MTGNKQVQTGMVQLQRDVNTDIDMDIELEKTGELEKTKGLNPQD